MAEPTANATYTRASDGLMTGPGRDDHGEAQVDLFSFRAADHAARYHEHGWLHVRAGATADFCDYVRTQLQQHRAHTGVERPALSVAKEQYVLDLPGADGILAQLFDTVSALCGLDRSRLVLSERHVNVYAADAAPCPRPHKDRLASQVSVGISIAVPPGSHLVLWPDDDRGTNPLQRPGLTESLLPHESPEHTLSGCREVVVHDAPGDVMVFPGSTTWHTRRNPAGAVVVYFKCNDFASDPLGEDPRTSGVEECSRRMARRPTEMCDAVLALSRRFESVSHEHPLRIDTEWINVHVSGQPPVRITDRELTLLEAVDGRATVQEVCAGTGADRAAVVRLVQLGALELGLADPAGV